MGDDLAWDTGDWVAGPVSIEMWSVIFVGTTCSPCMRICHVDSSSGLHSHFAFFNLKFFCSYFRTPQSRRPVKGVSSSKFASGFDSMANLSHW